MRYEEMLAQTDLVARRRALPIVRAFARGAHAGKGQKYGDSPYVAHLDAVVAVLRRFGARLRTDADLIFAAYLHDVLEDTAVTSDDISRVLVPLVGPIFSTRVIDLVSAVTDGPGASRLERHLKTYSKIVSVPGARRLKLADRIANVEQCWVNIGVAKAAGQTVVRNGKLEMYRDENPGFAAGLWSGDLPSKPPETRMLRRLNELFAREYAPDYIVRNRRRST